MTSVYYCPGCQAKLGNNIEKVQAFKKSFFFEKIYVSASKGAWVCKFPVFFRKIVTDRPTNRRHREVELTISNYQYYS